MIKSIKNKILKYELINWRKCLWFQPEKIKKQSKIQLEKLKTSLVNNGFSSPMAVWQKGKKIYIIDAHHRQLAMKELELDGVKIPEKLPAIFLDIKNEKEAKKIWAIYQSQYAELEQTEVIDFLGDFNLDDLGLEIDIPDIKLEIWKPIDNEQEIDENIEIKNKCPKCAYVW